MAGSWEVFADCYAMTAAVGKAREAAKGTTDTGSTWTCQPGMREALLRRLEWRVHGILREAAGRFSVHKWGHGGQSVGRTGTICKPPEVTVPGIHKREKKGC